MPSVTSVTVSSLMKGAIIDERQFYTSSLVPMSKCDEQLPYTSFVLLVSNAPPPPTKQKHTEEDNLGVWNKILGIGCGCQQWTHSRNQCQHKNRGNNKMHRLYYIKREVWRVFLSSKVKFSLTTCRVQGHGLHINRCHPSTLTPSKSTVYPHF